MSKFFVYELWDDRTNTIFYVGKGTNNRAHIHEKRAMNINNISHKDLRIRAIKNDGGNVVIKYVFKTDNEQEAFDTEIKLIALYGRHDKGDGPLLNHTDGGDGGDTTQHLTPTEIALRYEKRQRTMEAKPEIEKQEMYEKKSNSLKLAWEDNHQEWSENIKKGIRKNRNKETHSQAVSNGWKNRSPEEKMKTNLKRKKIRAEFLETAEGQTKMKKAIMAANLAVSKPIKVTSPEGKVFISNSISEWCREFSQSNNISFGYVYNSVSNLLNGWIPSHKANRWNGWSAVFI